MCMCATVRCSLVTDWFGMQTDWCVGCELMSVNVPSLMVFDVDVNGRPHLASMLYSHT